MILYFTNTTQFIFVSSVVCYFVPFPTEQLVTVGGGLDLYQGAELTGGYRNLTRAFKYWRAERIEVLRLLLTYKVTVILIDICTVYYKNIHISRIIIAKNIL